MSIERHPDFENLIPVNPNNPEMGYVRKPKGDISFIDKRIDDEFLTSISWSPTEDGNQGKKASLGASKPHSSARE